MTSKSIAEYLKSAGWDVQNHHSDWPGRVRSFVSFLKTMEDGVDVIISIHVSGSEFHVWSSVEHRFSGPYDTHEKTDVSLAAAMESAKELCDEWDSDQSD